MARSHDLRPRTATNMHNPTIQVRMAVLEAVNEYLDPTEVVELDDIYIVMFTYILDSWKAMVSTTIADDRYYEVTHRAGGETFVDVYEKVRQKVIPADDAIHNL